MLVTDMKENSKRTKGEKTLLLCHNLDLISLATSLSLQDNSNHNFRHGYGIYRYSNGDIYDGSWSNGNQQGAGLLLYASGNRLEGKESRSSFQ